MSSSTIKAIVTKCTNSIEGTEELVTAPPTIFNLQISLNHHIIDILAPTSSSPVTLGKTVLSLTFQAALALMIFHFQGPPALPPDRPPILVEIVEVAMIIGFAGALAGVLLQHAYPLFALYMEYAGSFAAAFGFLGIASRSLSKTLSLWLLWPISSVLILVVLILALLKVQVAAATHEILTNTVVMLFNLSISSIQ